MTDTVEEMSTLLSAAGVSSNRMESSNTTNNFENLSDEIILEILKFLDIKTLCICSQVNQRLRTLTQDPFLYRNLNLSKYARRVNDTVFNNLAPRCKYLSRLILMNLGHKQTISPETFKSFLRICGNSLRDIHLHFCPFVNDSIIEEIPLICPNLKKLSLEYLKVSDIGYRSLTALNTLESLEITSHEIEQATLLSIIRKNPKIRHLYLSRICYTNVDQVPATIGLSCPNCESLDLLWTNLSWRGLIELSQCRNLRHVDIIKHPYVPLDRENLRLMRASLHMLFTYCIHLTTVCVAGHDYIDDEVIEPLLSCPIEILDVTYAMHLSAEMCSRFFVCWPRLKKLYVGRCLKINSVDIRKWQSQYPAVSIRT